MLHRSNAESLLWKTVSGSQAVPIEVRTRCRGRKGQPPVELAPACACVARWRKAATKAA